MPNPPQYSIFSAFMDRYRPSGFQNIDRQDPFITDMERMLKANKQFFYVGDPLLMKIFFTSNGSKTILGIEPTELNFATFFTRAHPDDQARYNLAKIKVLKAAHELFIKKEGSFFHSSHYRQPNAEGKYINLLFQIRQDYASHPHETVHTLLVLTDLSKFKIDKHGYHHYVGNDPAYFRYPDDELLKTGLSFSDREFEILKLIAHGFGSEQIADKLFLSVNTVNTHRRNLLSKTRKATTLELVIELQENGIL